MRTPSEIINNFQSNDEYPSYYNESNIELMMKDYAQQWVHEFALQTFHHLDIYDYQMILSDLEPQTLKRIEEQ